MKRFISILLVLTMALSMAACGSPASTQAPAASQTSGEQGGQPEAGGEQPRTVTDITGNVVEVPDDPKNIAAMTGPSYEMVFMLDEADRINMVKSGHTTNYPLALLTNPDLANFNTVAANPSSSVNIEDYLKEGIDLVLYYENDTELKKFRSAGIPVIVVTSNTGLLATMEEVLAQSIDDYIGNITRPMTALKDAIGTEKAAAEFDTWYEYTDRIIRMLYERTKDLTDEQRPVVYWGNTWGENILASYSVNNRWYEVDLAGGRLVGPEEGGGNFPEVTEEQLFQWDPDIILVDNHGNYPELVIESMYKEGSKWETLKAVQNKNLARIPAGVFFLDKGSTTPLMTLWMATVIQPELFSDIDIVKEVQNYYIEFYEYDMTLEEAERVVTGWYDFSTFE